MDTSKITNVLIFKDGYYYLTANVWFRFKGGADDHNDHHAGYQIIPKEDFAEFGIDRNGFEFASDAYAYIARLQGANTGGYDYVSPAGEPDRIGYDKEEERLKERGEV